jgi:16S rRNA (adenine1518-N6/adenine1519-N6)-dimethyltransferase
LPRKLGQHFLIRDSILERLATAACQDHPERVIEIGPGRGALTRHLLPKVAELHAVEVDPTLVAYLHEKFAVEPNLTIHQVDVLQANLAEWGPAVIAGNLPYYITSPIIDRFLGLDAASFPSAVFLIQWEVAERLLAKPHTRDYGYLTVKTQLACDVQLVCRVPPGAFSPPPKVDSAAVRLVRRQSALAIPEGLVTFVGRCFAHKRKTLRNNLKPFYPAEALEALPEAGLRAEQIAVAQFVDLYGRLSAAS